MGSRDETVGPVRTTYGKSKPIADPPATSPLAAIKRSTQLDLQHRLHAAMGPGRPRLGVDLAVEALACECFGKSQ